MELIILSHKETWLDLASPSGYSTIGGFPFQMQAVSELVDRTILITALRSSPPPNGMKTLGGHNLQVCPVPEPTGKDLRRKFALLAWLPRHLPHLWCEIRKADAVHAPVPGDVGTIGILVALVQGKPLFVRHCGTWGNTTSLADRFLNWLLPRIAGGRNVVLATGGGDTSPSAKTPAVHWIFSTSLSESELASLPAAHSWRPGEPLRLVTVSRLTTEKNVAAIIRALPLIKKQTKKIYENQCLPVLNVAEASISQISLDIVGDGEARTSLETLAADLELVDRVTFHGNVLHEDVLHILTQAHLFVFPTRVKEGFPKAVLEALACGLPVIATDVSVIPHLIKDSGYVLPDTTPEAVAEAICQLIVNPKQIAEMGANARRRAQSYTLERWRDEIGRLLETAWGPLRTNG